jgi:dynactin complex subunit
MGRHVNYADEQDRWLNKADKINRNNRQREIPLEDRDPGTLSLLEQMELVKRRRVVEKQKAEIEAQKAKTKQTYFSLYRPK